MIDDISLQIIFTAIGAAVALASVSLTNYGQRKLEKEKFERNQKSEKEKFERNQKSEQAIFLRGQLEELTFLSAKWYGTINFRTTIIEQIINGEIERSEGARMIEEQMRTKENGMSEIDRFQRIQVIVNLYFPSLLVSFDEVFNANYKVLSDFSNLSDSRIDAKEYFENLEILRTTSKTFLRKLAKHSKELTNTD